MCLWFLARSKNDGKRRDRRKQTLFIDARNLGTMVDRVHCELGDADIAKIASTYHAWRADKGAAKYEDVAGFCKSATLEEIKGHGFVLTPGRYVGAEQSGVDEASHAEIMARLTKALARQLEDAKQLDASIRSNLEAIGYAL